MQNVVLIKGRLTGPRSVELDEPVTDMTGEVEVILRPYQGADAKKQSVSAFLSSLPPGTRSREQIDQQLREERGEWERNT